MNLTPLRLAVFAGMLGTALLAQPPSLLAIKDARIVPVKGAPIEKGTIVIRDGKIADAGASVTIPAGAWVLEGAGLTVYPGFTDALSSWGLAEAAPAPPAAAGAARAAAPAAPAQAATRSRGPEDRPGANTWVRAADLVRPSDRRLEQARAAGFTTAVAFPRQGLLAGHGAVISLAGETSGQMVIQPSAGLFATMQVSGYSGFPGTPMGMMSYLRQLRLDADHYRAAKNAYEANPASAPRPDYDRALEGMAETKRLLLPAISRVQIERMVRFAEELNVDCVLYGGHEAFRAETALKQRRTPVIVNVKWPEKAREADPAAEDSFRELETRAKAPSSPAALAAAGIPFAFTSDGLATPRDLLRGIKRAIDAGLKREDAIRALTLTPAEIFGIADRMGSIEPGRIANLTVVKGDPFAEDGRIEMVFIDGVKYLPAPEAPAAPPGAQSSRPSQEVEQ